MQAATASAALSRRRYPRAAPAPGRPVVVDVNGEDFIDVLKARDISEGGIGIFVPHRFAQCRIEAEVTVIVSLPAPVSASFSALAKIRHKSDEAFGIQFTRLREDDRQLIRRYVQIRAGEEAGSWWQRLRARFAV